MIQNFEDLKSKIEQWAYQKGLASPASADKQLLKLFEEAGELAAGHIKKDHDKTVDSVGDTLVVLIIYCLQMDLDINDCLEHAWNEIKDRTGQMIDGSFVKSEDLR